MFDWWRRVATVLDHPSTTEAEPREPTFAVGAEREVVQQAIAIIQRHIDKEAHNRRLRELPVRDLCPMQKAALVKDLARLLH